MKKQVIRLTESDLHRIIKESVNRILKEEDYETYIDKLRRQDAEKKASWDAWENTSDNFNEPNLPTELDNKLMYDLNKSEFRRKMENRPENNDYRTYMNFTKEPSKYLKGFNAMQALDDNEKDFYRDASYWNGIQK